MTISYSEENNGQGKQLKQPLHVYFHKKSTPEELLELLKILPSSITPRVVPSASSRVEPERQIHGKQLPAADRPTWHNSSRTRSSSALLISLQAH